MKDVKNYDPNIDKAGYAEVPIGQKVEQVKNGGSGSGNFGHEGRPGEQGGSGGGGGKPASTTPAGKGSRDIRVSASDLGESRAEEKTRLAAAKKDADYAKSRTGYETMSGQPSTPMKVSPVDESKGEPKKQKSYNPDTDRPGTAFAPQGQKAEMITNPPYQTPELGEAPEEMKKEADKIYKGLRKDQFHAETPAARESAARVMWSVLEKTWHKDKDGKWVKKPKE